MSEEYQNAIINGKNVPIAGNPLKLGKKVTYKDANYIVYRIRAEGFDAYFYLRDLHNSPE